MKIYTCALLPFEASDSFFTRDSGLLCHYLLAAGVESRVIMPANPGNEVVDPVSVVRAEKNQFASPVWWKSLEIDCVVFITWGFKEHTPVIRAARAAGIRTCTLFDTNGDSFPYTDFFVKPQILWRKGKFNERLPERIFGTIARTLLCAFKGLTRNYHQSVQMGVPHIAAFQTPKTMERCLHAARFFPWIASDTEPLVMGYAIPDTTEARPAVSRRVNVVAVARWDAPRHKRPHMLIHVIERVIRTHPDATFEIFGRLTPAIEKWHGALEDVMRERVLIHGVKPSAVVMEAVGSSQLLYCPSVEEGVPLPVVEALCCGCSVAGLGTPAVPGLYWAISEGDGSAALNDSVGAHADAVIAELNAWSKGLRDPILISKRWKKWFSGSEVARKIIQLLAPPKDAVTGVR